MQNLTIDHAAGDCSYNIDGNTFDVYRVKSKGKPVAEVRFDYGGDSGKTTITLQNIYPNEACSIAQCMGNEHLLVSVVHTILKGFGEDHSFYCEQFEDEDGNAIEKPLQMLPL